MLSRSSIWIRIRMPSTTLSLPHCLFIPSELAGGVPSHSRVQAWTWSSVVRIRLAVPLHLILNLPMFKYGCPGSIAALLSSIFCSSLSWWRRSCSISLSRAGRSLGGCTGRSDLTIFIGSRFSLRGYRYIACGLIARNIISDKALIIHDLDRAVSEGVHYVLLWSVGVRLIVPMHHGRVGSHLVGNLIGGP